MTSITIDIPMPVTRELSHGQRYFLPDVLFPNKPKESVWINNPTLKSEILLNLVDQP